MRKLGLTELLCHWGVLIDKYTKPVPVDGKVAEALYWALRLVMHAGADLVGLRRELGSLLGCAIKIAETYLGRG
jgi:hypothetical protein